jgi:hypothetical protein
MKKAKTHKARGHGGIARVTVVTVKRAPAPAIRRRSEIRRSK